MSNLARLAKEATRFFRIEAGRCFVKDGAPQWVRDLVFAAHDEGEFLPDDWRYDFARAAVDLIAAGETSPEMMEPDVSLISLTDWMGSHPIRPEYVDEAAETFGHGKSVIDDIQAGQWLEMSEVFSIVLNFLQNLADQR